MLKYLLSPLVIVLVASSLVKAQFKAGDRLVGLVATIGVSNSENVEQSTRSSSKSFAIGMGADYLKMKSSKYGSGIRVRTGLSQQESTIENSNSIENGYSAGVEVFGRNYFSLTKKIYFHLEYGLGASFAKSKRKTLQSSTNNIGFSGYLTPGLTLFTNKRIILEANLNPLVALGYNKSKMTIKNGSTSQDSFLLNTNLFSNNLFSNVSIGVKWCIK